MSFVPLAALFTYAATLWSASIKRRTENLALTRYLASLIRKMEQCVTHFAVGGRSVMTSLTIRSYLLLLSFE